MYDMIFCQTYVHQCVQILNVVRCCCCTSSKRICITPLSLSNALLVKFALAQRRPASAQSPHPECRKSLPLRGTKKLRHLNPSRRSKIDEAAQLPPPPAKDDQTSTTMGANKLWVGSFVFLY